MDIKFDNILEMCIKVIYFSCMLYINLDKLECSEDVFIIFLFL